MSTCFVIQPFDGDKFDKRYQDTFKPAIEHAGLEPYRVDKDPTSSIPINQIESGIRNARLCLAEITTDNPNVWFELGYAIAVRKDVVLVCSEERKSHFPFDVQHRAIIIYKCGAPQDFSDLGTKITERVKGLLEKEEDLSRVSANSAVKDTEGLSPAEIAAPVAVATNTFVSSEPVGRNSFVRDMDRAGYTIIAAKIAMNGLLKKGMVENVESTDQNGNDWWGTCTTEEGDAWLATNQHLLELTNEVDPGPPPGFYGKG